MHLRREEERDREAVHAVVASAFGREGEAKLVDALRRDASCIPQLSLVAEDNSRIVAHILFTRIVIADGAETTPGLALAPLAVHLSHQNLGLGSALSRFGLSEARRLGHSIVVVLGHATYYPRFGFLPANPRGIAAPFPVNADSFKVCELFPEALDGVRGTVIYALPFSAV